ncbi:MAG: hypothetical protein ACJAUP_001046 [Cellvibrionaceae bacterium]|jgi:hypothetical protein
MQVKKLPLRKACGRNLTLCDVNTWQIMIMSLALLGSYRFLHKPRVWELWGSL